MGENYQPDTFVGRYVDLCKRKEHPLSRTQIGFLEQTINDIFGLKNTQEETSKTELPINEAAMSIDRALMEQLAHPKPGRIFKILEQVKQASDDDTPLTDSDVLTLYELSANGVGEGFKTFNENHGLCGYYGKHSFEVLRRYLKHKGLISATQIRFPEPNYGLEEIESQRDAIVALDIDLIKQLTHGDCRKTGKFIGVIRKYKNLTRRAHDDVQVTDSDALSLYKLTMKEGRHNFPVLKKQYGLSNAYGEDLFKVLSQYVNSKGLTDKSE